MAQNLRELPPSKRFKILNSVQFSWPLNTTNEDDQKSLPAKKRAEIPGSSSTSGCLPAKKHAEILYSSSASSCLPAKKRGAILNSSSTTVCLPAKKRVWEPHPLSPTKSETQAQDADSLVQEKGRIRDGDASIAVPVKKRVWAPRLLSPTKTETQAPHTDPKHADMEGQIKGGEETNRLPAKKRVWIENPLTPALLEAQEEVTDLKSVQEKYQINDAKEMKEIHGVPAKKQVSAPNLLLAIQEVAARKLVGMKHPLTPALLEAREETTNLESVQEKDQINKLKEVKKINGVSAKKRVSAPNPLSAIQEVTARNRVWMEHPLTPALLDTQEEVTNLKSFQQKDEIKAKEVKETHEVPAKKRVPAPNPSSAIREVAPKKQARMENPLTPALLGFQEEATTPEPVQEKDQIKAKEVKESHGVPAKKRVLAPNPSTTSREVTTKKQVWMDNPLTPALLGIEEELVTNLKSVQEKDQIKVKEANEIHGFAPKKRVWAPNNRVCAVHPLSPITEEKEQPEYQTKRSNEICPVLAKRRVWAPEPLDPTKNQIKQHTDPKPVELRAENEFPIKDENKICGVPLKQVYAMHPVSPTKTETQIEEKGPESIEEEIDDGVLCAVCHSTDGDPSDPIVFCDGCDLMVHASCYGNPLIKSIPEGDWFCSACSSKLPPKEKRCCLCPVRGGALKPTVDDKWAHVMCALLVPEVFFRDPEGRDGIDCSRVPSKRWQKDCFICGRNCGCALDCAESKCKLGFHVSCGLEEGLCIEYREGKGGDIVAGFCTEHTKLWEKQQLTGKFKIVSTD